MLASKTIIVSRRLDVNIDQIIYANLSAIKTLIATTYVNREARNQIPTYQ